MYGDAIEGIFVPRSGAKRSESQRIRPIPDLLSVCPNLVERYLVISENPNLREMSRELRSKRACRGTRVEGYAPELTLEKPEPGRCQRNGERCSHDSLQSPS
jgi:hypothetical protein